jgi:uncharacterized membrane protein YeaQ/YmgE (transglycosylase-associated protein family)
LRVGKASRDGARDGISGLLVILLAGLIAGWLAGKIVAGGDLGLIGDVAVGIVGALIGTWLLPGLGIHIGSGFVSTIVVATIGAVLLLLIIGLVSGDLHDDDDGAFRGGADDWEAIRVTQEGHAPIVRETFQSMSRLRASILSTIGLAQLATPTALAQTQTQQQSKPGSKVTTKMEDVSKWSRRQWTQAKAKWSQKLDLSLQLHDRVTLRTPGALTA